MKSKRTWYPTKEAWARARLAECEAAATAEVKWDGSKTSYRGAHSARRSAGTEADRFRRLAAMYARLGI